MARLFGLGVGIVVLALIWLGAVLGCVVLSRHSGPDGAVAPTLVAAIVTLILVFFPRELPTPTTDVTDVTIMDVIFIPRTCLIVFMAITLLVASVVYLLSHCTHKVQLKPLSDLQRKKIL